MRYGLPAPTDGWWQLSQGSSKNAWFTPKDALVLTKLPHLQNSPSSNTSPADGIEGRALGIELSAILFDATLGAHLKTVNPLLFEKTVCDIECLLLN